LVLTCKTTLLELLTRWNKPRYSRFYNIKNVLSPANPSTLDNRYLKNRGAALANVDLGYKTIYS
jgi:hypothetical protein